jgi:L-Ala-D/L-Glu epimerase
MLIERLHLRTAELQRTDRSWRTATYAAPTVSALYVAIEAAGQLGVGATSAKTRHDTLDELLPQVTGLVRPALEGSQLDAARSVLRQLSLRPRVRVAIDLALHDLLGKLSGLPAEAHWGGRVRNSVPVIRMVGLKTPAELPEAVAPLIESGYRHLKIKGGTGVTEDTARIRILRESFGDSLDLTLDVNGAYSVTEAVQLCRLLDGQRVDAVEQPVDYKDIPGLAVVRRSSAIDILADQCVHDTASAAEVCRAGAADIISVKLTKMGSVEACSRVAQVGQAFGVRVRMGGSAAPGLVDGAACRLVLSDLSLDEAAEVGESAGLEESADGGPQIEDGLATLGHAPGLGGPDSLFGGQAEAGRHPR